MNPVTPTASYRRRILGLLGDRDVMTSLAGTAQKLETVLYVLDEEGLSRTYQPGKWTARQILAHLADMEIAFGLRLRQAIADESSAIQVFDPDVLAGRYTELCGEQAVQSFSAARAWNLAFIGTLGPKDRDRDVVHPERGRESVDLMIRMIAGHDLNHLAQLDLVAGK